jgi:branched-chain amino acid transport system substrate-binding protein
MSKIAVLRILNGNLEQGFQGVQLEIIDPNTGTSQLFGGSLPSSITLQQSLQEFRDAQTEWGRYYRWWRVIEPPDEDETDTDPDLNQRVINALNDWLRSQDFLPLRDALNLNLNQLERLTIQTDNQDLERLPWSRWNVITNHPNVEVFLGKNPKKYQGKLRKPVRILAVLGNCTNINLSVDEEFIKYLPGAKTKTLRQPTRAKFNNALEDDWDILFFAGHSQTNEQGDDAILHLNDTESVTIGDLIPYLQSATIRGLKIAIFNSCNGLGIPRKLSEQNVNIPYLIVMREPIHDKLAHKFLELFTKDLVKGKSVQQAFQEARRMLSLYRPQSPNADYLPVIFHHPENPPLFYPKVNIVDQLGVEYKKKIDSFSNWYKKKTEPFYRWWINLNTWVKFAIPFILALLICLVIFYVKGIIFPNPLVAASACNNTPAFISCGEKPDFLNFPQNLPLLQEEIDGRKAFTNGNYKEAVDYLEKAWKIEKDPTALIALNNARVMGELKSGNISPKNVFTIAISSGFTATPDGIGGSILTGVAWRQDEFNKPSNIFRLIVVMADDSNNKIGAVDVAKEFVKRDKIIGVIGPYSSHATYYALDEYRKGKIVLVSATSTATVEAFNNRYKKENKSQDMSWFFRPVPTTKIAAEQLVKYLEKKGYQQVMIFYQDNDLFAQSFYNDIINQLQRSNIKTVEQINVDKGQDNEQIEAMASFKQRYHAVKDKTALILLTDAYTNPQGQNRKLSIIEENNGKFFIAGSNTLFDNQVLVLFLKIGKESLENMVITIPWYPSPEESKKIAAFVSNNQQPWSSMNDPELIWQMAMSYEATKMLGEAILEQLKQGQIPTRAGTRNVLALPSFKIEGLTGTITLKGSDRKDQFSSLVSADCSTTPCSWREIESYPK